tara:strand:- start:559 stop:1536 length:978 start_codon:yes stop_codon:yes gene_type:complete
MHYMLTGGYGCIGSWIVKNLIEQGHEVSIYDITENTDRMALIIEADDIEKVNFVDGDISDGIRLNKAIGDLGISHLIHLAGLQVPICRAYPIRGAMVNVIGTINVFEAAKIHADTVKRVVYASSAAVYGMEEEYGEGRIGNDAVLKPLTHYGVFKQCNEGSARVYHLDYGISSVGLRPWTVYGPGRDFGLTSDPTKAVKAALLKRPFVIKYGGRNNMQYVNDTARIFLRCAEADYEGAGVYSIRGDVVTMDEVVRSIERVVPDAKGLITHTENTIPIAADLDDRALVNDIGQIPYTSLDEGIRKTYDIFKQHHEAGRLSIKDLDE